MRLSDFDFDLPEDRIAQQPAEPRDASRLLVLPADRDGLEHVRFSDLPAYLSAGDLLVFNDTRVLPARLSGRKESGGRVDLLMVEQVSSHEYGETWRCLMQVARKPAPGSWLSFGDHARARVLERGADGWLVRFPRGGPSVQALLRDIGRMPLPPYIRREDGEPDEPDRERYQTVYARTPGAVAAPTAGLHFTETMLASLEDAGISRALITLHVGPGTFIPVRSARITDHRMHEERFVLPETTAAAIDETRRRGGRVVAVGTTVVRTLEACVSGNRRVAAGEGRCDLFIYPGYRFRVVDAMVTNFHLPRSTLLMLVSAFAGRLRLLAAYDEALRAGYRFYSYGDAMLVIGGR